VVLGHQESIKIRGVLRADEPTLDRAAAAVMARIAEDAAQQSGGKVQFASLDAMRSKSAASITPPEVSP
jgi:hypothetical protein